MRAGDSVALFYGAANRDWRKFPDPDQFDIDRRSKGYLGFGMGKHFCIGSYFARMVTEAAMNRFLKRVLDYELQQGGFEWVSSSNFRSPMILPFRIG